MTERETEREPSWGDDVLLGELALPEGPALVRLRLHQAAEAISDRTPIVQLAQPIGSRVHVHAQPYVLTPEIALTVGLSPTPRAAHGVGEVLASTWAGMRHVAIGQAQGLVLPRRSPAPALGVLSARSVSPG